MKSFVTHWGDAVLSTISYRDGEYVQHYHANLQIDNTGVVERKLKAQILKIVAPLARKLLRTVGMPPGLIDREMIYLERLEWPKSKYLYAILLQSVQLYNEVSDSGPLDLSLLEMFSHPYCKAAVHKYDGSLERNRRAMSKGNGLPRGGTKRDNFTEFVGYVEEKVKPNPILENCLSIMPGVRTQQSHPDNPKVRLVFGLPGQQWYIECECIDDAISSTVESISTGQKIFVFYTERSVFQEWVTNNWSNVVQWANLDAANFDSSVTASEIKQMVEYFAPNYEFKDLVSEYLVHASLVMPEGDLPRDGGIPSGSKTTNLFDGFCNILDILEALARYKLLKYVECICVNGDDISIGLSTRLTNENLEKIGSASRRNIHAEKSVLGDFVWNSKWYIDENLMTRPVFRVLNNMMFSERMKSAIYGSKEYIELAIAQQCEDIEQHPFGEQIIKSVAGISKYHISTMTNEQLLPAAEAYQDAHSWKEGEDVNDLLARLRGREPADSREFA